MMKNKYTVRKLMNSVQKGHLRMEFTMDNNKVSIDADADINNHMFMAMIEHIMKEILKGNGVEGLASVMADIETVFIEVSKGHKDESE
jgi:hypothetical protein